MKNDWILEVLGDLKGFASKNDLPALSEQLDDTFRIAVSELAIQSRKQQEYTLKSSGYTGTGRRGFRSRQN